MATQHRHATTETAHRNKTRTHDTTGQNKTERRTEQKRINTCKCFSKAMRHWENVHWVYQKVNMLHYFRERQKLITKRASRMFDLLAGGRSNSSLMRVYVSGWLRNAVCKRMSMHLVLSRLDRSAQAMEVHLDFKETLHHEGGELAAQRASR